jgi:hypothetical protein
MPSLRSLLPLALALMVLSQACSVNSKGVDSSGASNSSGGSAVERNSGDCDVDADCPGAKCVAVTPGGFRVCTTAVPEAMGCKSPMDQCCSTESCTGDSKCFAKLGTCDIQGQYYNTCRKDECETDADCTIEGFTELCVPAGVLQNGTSFCMNAVCYADKDCKEVPGGKCAPIFDGFIGIYVSLACIYPSDGCRSEKDCLGSQTCKIEGQRARCVNGTFDCPN